MGKSKALETALNKKLLSSHEHLKKCTFLVTSLGLYPILSIPSSIMTVVISCQIQQHSYTKELYMKLYCN